MPVFLQLLRDEVYLLFLTRQLLLNVLGTTQHPTQSALDGLRTLVQHSLVVDESVALAQKSIFELEEHFVLAGREALWWIELL